HGLRPQRPPVGVTAKTDRGPCRETHRSAREDGPMTEAEWLACADPGAMLFFLRQRVGNRKFWLFAAAGGARASHFLPEAVREEMTQVGAGLADGRTTPEELLGAWYTFRECKERSVEEQDFELAAALRDWQHILLGREMLRYGVSADEMSRMA